MPKKPQKQAKNPSDTANRDEKGRFVSGNTVGTGENDPSRSKSKKLKDAVIATVSESDIKDIIKKQVEKAKEGNTIAAKEVLDRCIGKPKEISDVSVTYPQLTKPLTLEEMKKRILTAERVGTGLDQRSIEGGKTS